MEDSSIPQKSSAYLNAQDIFFKQFNDVSFFVEDTDMENFYFHTLSKLFNGVKIHKIFPLGGKTNLLNHAALNLDSKNNIYVTDKDFDDILSSKVILDNVFYLKKYSIENYLLEKKPFVEYVVAERPKLNPINVSKSFRLKSYLDQFYAEVYPLIVLYLVVQIHLPDSGIKNTSINIFRFFENTENIQLKQKEFDDYKESIEKYVLASKSGKSLRDYIEKVEALFNTEKYDFKENVPGKYIMGMIDVKLRCQFALPRGVNHHMLCYRIAKESKFLSLSFLKKAVEKRLASS